MLIIGLEEGVRLLDMTPWAKSYQNLESFSHQQHNAHKIGMEFNKILVEELNENLLIVLLLQLESLEIMLQVPTFELLYGSKPPIPVNNTSASPRSFSLFYFYIQFTC